MLAAIPYTTFPDHRHRAALAADVRPRRRHRRPRRGVARRSLRRGVPHPPRRHLRPRHAHGGRRRHRLAHHLGASPTATSSTRRSTPSPSGRAACSSPAASSFAVIAGYPIYHHWNRLTRWHSLDGYAYGLAIGLGIGRIGCYAVGEHFGARDVVPAGRALRRRLRARAVPRRPPSSSPGMVFHQTALYEFLYMVVLFLLLTYVLYGRKQRPGAGHRRGDLLRLLRGRPLRLRLAPGQRRAGARAHRRAVPLPRHAAGQRLDLVPGAASSWRATSRPACRWASTRRNRRMRKPTYRR